MVIFLCGYLIKERGYISLWLFNKRTWLQRAILPEKLPVLYNKTVDRQFSKFIVFSIFGPAVNGHADSQPSSSF